MQDYLNRFPAREIQKAGEALALYFGDMGYLVSKQKIQNNISILKENHCISCRVFKKLKNLTFKNDLKLSNFLH